MSGATSERRRQKASAAKKYTHTEAGAQHKDSELHPEAQGGKSTTSD